MDSYGMFASCLRGIGDPRGIEKLQGIYANENDATYIGNAMECLSMIHNLNIQELPVYESGNSEDYAIAWYSDGIWDIH